MTATDRIEEWSEGPCGYGGEEEGIEEGSQRPGDCGTSW